MYSLGPKITMIITTSAALSAFKTNRLYLPYQQSITSEWGTSVTEAHRIFKHLRYFKQCPGKVFKYNLNIFYLFIYVFIHQHNKAHSIRKKLNAKIKMCKLWIAFVFHTHESVSYKTNDCAKLVKLVEHSTARSLKFWPIIF